MSLNRGLVLSARSFFKIGRKRVLSKCLSNDNLISANGSPVPKKFTPVPYQYHQELTVDIEDLTNEGLGIARHNGWVIMVPLVIPGEKVVLRIFRNHPNYSEADLVKIVEPSPNRVTAQCQYFEVCGGCQYQHISIESQRVWKKQQVISLLQRLGGINNITVNDAVGTSNLYEYRTKITPHYDSLKEGKPIKIGFQQRGTRIITDIEKCIIATPAINKKYSEFRESLLTKYSNQTQINLPKKGATLLFRECEEGVETNFRATITQIVENISFKFKAGEFFQNNAFILPLLVQHVISQAQGHNCDHLIDTYCGSGLFALTASSHFKFIYGIEISDFAIIAATNSAEINNIKNVKFQCGKSEAIFDKVKSVPADRTVVVIDPPRKGCDEEFLNQLFLFYPKKLVYVSCDPATQARDAKAIVAAGYEIIDVTPYDLFPQTRHIENVMTFIRPDRSI
eukprot:gene5084-10176_t